MHAKPFLILALAATLVGPASAHDTWLQTNTNVVRSGDAIYIELMLGNHGNGHRDFKIAGKANLAHCSLGVIGPEGKTFDLLPSLVDQGYSPKEGYWVGQFQPVKEGLYLVAQTSDEIASYAPERVVKSAKTFFEVVVHLDQVPSAARGYQRVLHHVLELVPQVNTIAPMGPEVPIRVVLLYKNQPLAGETVSFIPRGQLLSAGFDTGYERKTDAAGSASFTPKEANDYLIVAHHTDPNDSGEGYKSTKYSATLTVIVPALCPCCGD